MRTKGLLTVLGLALVAAPEVQAQLTKPDLSWEEGLSYYRDHINRPSLCMRTRTLRAMGQTRDPRGLAKIIAYYDKPQDPKDHEKYLCVAIVGHYFTKDEFLDTFAAWRPKKKKKNLDAWMWYRTLEHQLKGRDGEELVRIATDKGAKLFLRAAAIHAMATDATEQALPLMDTILDNLPRDKVERAVLVEALAPVMLSQSYRMGSKEFQNPVSRLIHQLSAKETLYRTKLTIARHLMKLFGTQTLIIDADPWLRRLAKNTGPEDKYAHLYAQPTFMGVKGTGKRICYVIDMSDSMMKPVKHPEAVPEPPKGPLTGPKKKAEEKDEKPAFPWHLVKNRFDAAREHLKLSLKGLADDMFFCVIFFGTKAGPLKATPGMRAATPENIRKAIRELDSIKPGPKQADRPHGTLRGYTNMHGGLRRAFKARNKRLTGKYEYVNKKAFVEGCDTIFLLSDGDPTYSDWVTLDKPDPDDRAGDPESSSIRRDTGLRTFTSSPRCSTTVTDRLVVAGSAG